MYVHLRGARVFPSDATQIPSLATPPSPCASNPVLASKFSLGLFFFFLLPFQSSGGGGQPRARAVQAGWLGRERLPRRGALVAACRAVWGRLRNPPTVRTHQQVRNNTGYLHVSCNPWIRLGNVLLHVENLLPFSKEISPTLCSDNRLASSAGSSVRMLCHKVLPAEAFPLGFLPQNVHCQWVCDNEPAQGPFLLRSPSRICPVPCSSGTRDWGGELREEEERCFPVHKDLTRKISALLLYRANPSAAACQKFPARFGFSEPCSGVTGDPLVWAQLAPS